MFAFRSIMGHMVFGLCFILAELVHIWKRLEIEHDIKLCSDWLKFHKLSSQSQHDEQNFHIKNVLWTGQMAKEEFKCEAKNQECFCKIEQHCASEYDKKCKCRDLIQSIVFFPDFIFNLAI